MNSKRIFCILLAALLALGLAACAQTSETSAPSTRAASTEATVPSTAPVTEAPTEPVTEPPTEPVTDALTEPVTEAPTEPVTDAPTEPVTDAPTEPATEAPTEAPPEGPSGEPTDFDSMLQYLVGVWNYYPVDEDAVDSPEVGGIPGISIQLNAEGSFFAIRHSDNAQCTGAWNLDWFFAEEEEAPDMILFEVQNADEGMETIGDFWIMNYAACAGTDRLALVQLNNGDSVFWNSYEVFAEMLIRGDYDPEAVGAEPKSNAEFVGMVWKVSGNGTELWMTEVSDEDFSVAVGSRTAARYPIAADAELIWPVTAFNQGGDAAVVCTNAAGEIFFLDWAEMTEGG